MTNGLAIKDKYDIKREIKRGGFGVIYEGLDRQFGKRVAIKAIDPGLLGEAKYFDMFYKEAINVACLNHYNIVQVYDLQRAEDGQLFIIMEYIDGPDLLTLLRACKKQNKTLPLDLGVHIIAEACNGLDYAHNRVDPETNEPLNIVHQDISPVNIMIARTGQVKIIDFGMATFRRNRAHSRKEVYVQGNIHYMSPEQLNGAAVIDRRADIFALGRMLYEFLTGERLIKSTNTREILETLVAGSWDYTRFTSERIPPLLREPLRKALEHHPKNRYANANLMYKDLLHYLILTAPAVDHTYKLAKFIASVNLENHSAEADEKDDGLVEIKEALALEKELVEPPPLQAPATAEHIHTVPWSTSDGAHEAITQPGPAASYGIDLSENIAESPAKKDVLLHSKYYSFIDDSAVDDQRTIIDIVRLSARTHRKAVTVGLLSVLAAFLLFTGVDTYAHFTPLGQEVYDFFFPPAIKIDSIPAGAQVYLDDRLLDQTTPLDLQEIAPGVHKLMLTLPQFEPIVKSINVPSKGSLRVSGEVNRHASQPYIFRFKTQFEISSVPSGADILINGVKLNQPTPATVFWEVTEEPIDVMLELPGLTRLTGLRINAIEGKEVIEDRRFWNIKPIVAGKAQYHIEGIFHKSITVNSNPSRADIFVNDGDKPAGVTGLDGKLMLTMGDHKITLRKNEYLPSSFIINVNENAQTNVNQELLRAVRIFAKDASASGDTDLDATIELRLNGKALDYRGKTPAVLQLLPRTHTLKLQKEGYGETVVDIPPTERSVVVEMHPAHSQVTIMVMDGITSQPLTSAKIEYRDERAPNSRGNQQLGVTDQNGQVVGKLSPGFYQVSVSKAGYQEQQKSLRVRADENTHLTFRLTILR